MKRIHPALVLVALVLAASVLLEARQQWVSTANGITTSGTVATTNGGSAALAVTGGADIGGVIQAGSGNVNITNSTGNLLPASLAAGTISTVQTFSAVPEASVGLVAVGNASNSTAVQIQGRSADNLSQITFNDFSAGTQYARIAIIATGILNFVSTATTGFRFSDGPLLSGNAQPGFLAYFPANGNLTIAGLTNVEFGTEVYDTSGVFSTPTFTAPVAGIYEICAAIQAATDTGTATFQVTTSAGVDAILGTVDTDTTAARVLHECMPLSLSASETVSIQTTVGGGQTITVFGSAGLRSWFSARLMP